MTDKGSSVPVGGSQLGVAIDRYTPPIGTAHYDAAGNPAAASSEAVLKETLAGQGKHPESQLKPQD